MVPILQPPHYPDKTEIVMSAELPTADTTDFDHDGAMPHTRLADAHAPGASTALLGVLSIIRIAQVLSWPAAVATGGTAGLTSPELAWVVWAVATGVSLIVVSSLWVYRRLIKALANLDMASATLCLVAGGLLTRAGHGTDFNHPALAIAIGTALTVALFWSLRDTLLIVAILAVAYVVGIFGTILLGPRALTSTFSNIAQLVGLPIVAGMVAQRIVGLVRRSSDLEMEVQTCRDVISAQDQRESERLRQYRTLHDTVLSTLSALSRGSLDTRVPDVQQRLAAVPEQKRSGWQPGAGRSPAPTLRAQHWTMPRTMPPLPGWQVESRGSRPTFPSGSRTHNSTWSQPTMLTPRWGSWTSTSASHPGWHRAERCSSSATSTTTHLLVTPIRQPQRRRLPLRSQTVSILLYGRSSRPRNHTAPSSVPEVAPTPSTTSSSGPPASLAPAPPAHRGRA